MKRRQSAKVLLFKHVRKVCNYKAEIIPTSKEPCRLIYFIFSNLSVLRV